MKNTEALAFDLWKSQVSESFKRVVMLEVFRLAAHSHNQSSAKVLFELKKRLPNVSETDFLDAVTSLKQFDAVGLYPIKGVRGNAFHLNVVRSEKWLQYRKYIEENYPHLCERS